MTRILRRDDHGPHKVQKPETPKDLYLCRCGLSANGIYCDSSHKATLDEDPALLYEYTRDPDGTLRRREVKVA